MRYFVRQGIKRGHCAIPNQYFRSISSDEAIIIFLKELNLNGNICEILVTYFESIKKIENKYDSQFEDYRVINEKGKSK